MRRAAEVDTIEVGAVFEGDEYQPVKGSAPHVRHVPNPLVPRTEATLIAVYVVCTFPSGRQTVWELNKQQVQAVRQRSKASASGPWRTDFVPMAIKTCIRSAAKYLPISAERAKLFEQAIAHDDETAGFRPAAPSEPRGVDDMLARDVSAEVVEDEVVEEPAKELPY